MANDTNTMGYNQWFYFAVQNMKTSTKYTFRVVNYVSQGLSREKNSISSNKDKE